MNEWVVLIVAFLIAAALALPGFWLLWRAAIQPNALTKMEARAASQEVRLDRHREIIDEQQGQLDELRAAMLADREEMAEMRAEMAEWRVGMRLVFEQMKAANIVPAWMPRERPERPRRGRTDSALVRRISSQFNIDEINGLAFDIGIHAEEFGGTTSGARARELVELVGRRGGADMAALIARVNELRPN